MAEVDKRSVLDWLEQHALARPVRDVTCRLYTKAFDRLCDELGAPKEQDTLLLTFDKGVIRARRVFVLRTSSADLGKPKHQVF